MKKLTVWALLAMFIVAGAAFAAPAKVAPNASNFGGGAPATTNNDDGCDIGVYPAATLLLPYFEVAEDPAGETTLFTITNVSSASAIAHVVLWTDWSFPVIDFNIYLTPYDVQGINLNDVIWRGVIAPAAAEKDEDGTGTDISPGADVDPDEGDLELGACVGLPGDVPDFYQQRMQDAFTLGSVAAIPGVSGSACSGVGGEHANAVGYATIDVVSTCGTGLPTDGDTYFTTEMRFDNVLIGDYQQVNSENNFAQGNPMVHIRAVPDTPGDTISETFDPGTNFERTFYSRYQDPLNLSPLVPNTLDRRQPLPAVFAARWIQGGDTDFQTSYKVWREGVTGADESCSAYEDNSLLGLTETVMFDEDENGYGVVGSDIIISPGIPGQDIVTPETSLIAVDNEDVFPQFADVDATAGWTYLNLNNGYFSTPADDTEFASQNWVVVSMRAEGRYSVDFDAAAMGNGCTPAVGDSEFSEGDVVIDPADNYTDCVVCP